MSEIPKAREILRELMTDPDVGLRAKRAIGRALSLMVREPYCRRAPARRQVIDKLTRQRVKLLVHESDLTMHQIADKTGLRSMGRVSEIMHGKR